MLSGTECEERNCQGGWESRRREAVCEGCPAEYPRSVDKMAKFHKTGSELELIVKRIPKIGIVWVGSYI